VIVTHKLREVMALARRVTVMRAGRIVGSATMEGVDPRRLAEMMVGHVPVPPRRGAPAGRHDSTVPLLRLRGITIRAGHERARLADVSLDVHRGEILGVLGVGGNGQRELAEVIGGIRVPDEGTTELAGKSIDGAGPAERVALGIAFVPEDRRGTGLAGAMTVAENLVLRTVHRDFARGPMVDRPAVTRNAQHEIERFGIRGGGASAPVSSLSGGNQQKVVLARELGGEPHVIVAASPTRGLDIDASQFVEERLLAERERGAAIVLVTEDIEQALRLCDRVAVMHGGRVVGSVAVDEADAARIGGLMAGFEAAT
jgi:simple sugar transport system ATP-binding protein